MIKVLNVSKRQNDKLILDNISFTVADNEILAITGPNGCGKTTLLKIIAGVENKDSGQILIDEQNKKIKTGLVFQDFHHSLLPWKTVAGNISFSLALHIKNPLERRQRLNQLLWQSNLHPHRHKYPYELSGGMSQLAVFTKTMALEPAIFLLDEPFSSLDYYSWLTAQKQFLNLWQEKKTPTIIITHNIEEAIFLADRIIILSSLPAKIIAVLTNNLPRPRDYPQLGSPAAHDLKKQILGQIQSFLL